MKKNAWQTDWWMDGLSDGWWTCKEISRCLKPLTIILTSFKKWVFSDFKIWPTDGQTNGQTDRQTNRHRPTNRQTDGLLDGKWTCKDISRCLRPVIIIKSEFPANLRYDRWTDGRTDGRTDGQTRGLSDGQVLLFRWKDSSQYKKKSKETLIVLNLSFSGLSWRAQSWSTYRDPPKGPWSPKNALEWIN